MLLPHLDRAVLYGQIHFEELVTSPVNSTATSSIVELFTCPSDAKFGGGGSYVACFGRGDMVRTPDDGDGVFFRNSRIRLRDIEDGAMTFLVGERKGAIGDTDWTGVHLITRTGFFPTSPTGGPIERSRVLGHTGVVGGKPPVHTPNSTGCPADFAGAHLGGTQFVMVDGSVRFVSNNVDGSVYAGLATRSGGEPVTDADF
jgi:hypothetical protein